VARGYSYDRGLLILLVIAVALLLHSDRFHSYLLRTAQEKASQALGGEVQFSDYSFHWKGMGPSVELYNIVVHGAPPYSNPPLLEANSSSRASDHQFFLAPQLVR